MKRMKKIVLPVVAMVTILMVFLGLPGHSHAQSVQRAAGNANVVKNMCKISGRHNSYAFRKAVYTDSRGNCKIIEIRVCTNCGHDY